MKKILGLVVLATSSVGLAQDTAVPDMSYQRTFETPYMYQMNKEYGPSGHNYCGPTSAAMAISWLGRHGFPQLVPPGTDYFARLRTAVKILASPEYMDTNPEEGTHPYMFIDGFAKYVQQAGYKVGDIAYAGWRIPRAGTPGRLVKKTADFSLLRSSLTRTNSVVFLCIGYYDLVGQGIYRRTGGHWVTVVGYGTSGNGVVDPNALLIHNPAHTYAKAAIQSKDLSVRLEQDIARLSPMEGVLQSAQGTTVRSLSGLFSIEGPALGHGPKHDVAIVDAVLAITLETP